MRAAQTMTRSEAETAILRRLREIRRIARTYAPGRPDLLLAVHGERLSLWNYAGDGDADLLDAWAGE